MPFMGQSHLHLCLDLLGLGHLSHCFHRILRSRRSHTPFFLRPFSLTSMHAYNFCKCVGGICSFFLKFVLVSTIVIGSVLPNGCLEVTLYSYFRFLFVTHKNYGVKRQRNLLTKISLLHVSTSVHQYASMSVRQYISTPSCGMAAVRQYVSMSVRQYVSTSVHQYAMLPKLYKPQQ